MAGTQNLQNTAQQHQETSDENTEDDADSKPPIKEDFMRAPNSQWDEKIVSADPFKTPIEHECPVDQLRNMTREAGDGQNDNGNENIE